MNELDSIKAALQGLQFTSFRQYVADLLEAFTISRVTIERMLSRAVVASSASPVRVYRRAIIKHDPTLKPDGRVIVPEGASAYRLVLVLGDAWAVCRDLVTGAEIQFRPDEISDHLHFFLPLIYGAAHNKDLETSVDCAELAARLFNELCVDERNRGANGHKRVTDFVLNLLYLSFGESLLQDKGFKGVVAWARSARRTDHTAIMEGVFNAVLRNDVRSAAYERLPTWDICRQTRNTLPHINAKAFDLAAKLLCSDLADVDTEVLGSLIYKLLQEDDASSVYGHLTSFENVARVLNPLFVTGYAGRIDRHKDDPARLKSLRTELLGLSFFDPTNGPGCFLASSLNRVIELISTIDDITGGRGAREEVDLGRFVGLVDNDVSQKLSHLVLWASYLQYLGRSGPVAADLKAAYERINIQVGDPLETVWAEVCANEGRTLIVGAPTFKGKKNMTAREKRRMKRVFGTFKSGNADFCSCWLVLAARYVEGTTSRCGLVLTNSVCQGSQVSDIWSRVYEAGCEISFARRSFKWRGRNQASTGVSVIVIGLSSSSHADDAKHLYDGDASTSVGCIGPYLVDSTDTIVERRGKPLSRQLPPMPRGNMPYDNGNLLLSKEEKNLLVNEHPGAAEFLKRVVGSKEYIDRIERWCLWIPNERRSMSLSIRPIAERVEKVRRWRVASNDANVRRMAARPHQFREFRSTRTQTLVVPLVSSENRRYVPMGFVGGDTIVTNLANAVYECPPWAFGVITSRMHMAWIRTVCGGLETRLRYSNTLGYNTFPFPVISAEKQEEIGVQVREIIRKREDHCDRTPGKLYGDLPPGLERLHGRLDDTIDAIYRAEPFRSDAERVRFLLQRYEGRNEAS